MTLCRAFLRCPGVLVFFLAAVSGRGGSRGFYECSGFRFKAESQS